MSNPNPKTEQLALGRGRRPIKDSHTVCMRLSPETRQKLEEIAESYNCHYGQKPWIAGLLEHIAEGHLMVVPSPPYQIERKRLKNLRDGAIAYIKRVVEKK
jgi:hypothetical protein